MVFFIKRLLHKNTFLIPRHIAIVCDGNCRWAKVRNLPRSYGYKASIKPIRRITKKCSKLGVEVLTFYAFSTKSWGKSPEDVDYLMKLFVKFFGRLRKDVGTNIKVKHIGNKSNFSPELVSEIDKIEKLTENNSGMVLNIALNYGGRFEIVDAVTGILKDVEEKVDIDKLSEDSVDKYMLTAGLPDVDLIIRTSGEMRINNFLLWQSSQPNFWATADYWPEFRGGHLKESILHYNRMRKTI